MIMIMTMMTMMMMINWGLFTPLEKHSQRMLKGSLVLLNVF